MMTSWSSSTRLGSWQPEQTRIFGARHPLGVMEEVPVFDATDLEIDRRAHAYEMGEDSKSDRAWSSWVKRAEACLAQLGWDEKFTGGKLVGQSRGLDGADDETGYSIDSAYDAFEAGKAVAEYMGAVKVARQALGL